MSIEAFIGLAIIVLVLSAYPMQQKNDFGTLTAKHIASDLLIVEALTESGQEQLEKDKELFSKGNPNGGNLVVSEIRVQGKQKLIVSIQH